MKRFLRSEWLVDYIMLFLFTLLLGVAGGVECERMALSTAIVWIAAIMSIGTLLIIAKTNTDKQRRRRK